MKVIHCTSAALLVAMATFCCAGNAAAAAVSVWPFEGNFDDATGNNNLSIASGAPGFSPVVPPGGFSTQSLDLGGSSHLENTSPVNFGFTSAYSVAGWMQLDVDGTSGTHRGILARSPAAGNASDIELYVQAGSNGFTIAHNRSNGGSFDFVRFPAPPDDTMFQFTYTYDGVTPRLFFDGVEQLPNQGWNGSSVVTPPDPDVSVLFTPTLSASPKINVADIDSSFTTVEFPGLLDDLGVFDRALTDGEVLAITNLPAFGVGADLLDVSLLIDQHELGSGNVALSNGEIWSFVSDPALFAGHNEGDVFSFTNAGMTGTAILLDGALGTGMALVVVPEPSSLTLVAAASLAWLRRRRSR